MSMRNTDVGSLEERCFKEIVKKPLQTMTPGKVEEALFSKRARKLVRRSTDLSGAGFAKSIDTVRLRQRIITKLVDEGRGLAGGFPAPPAFLDESFTSLSLAGSKIGDSFVRDTLSKRCTKLKSVDLTGCFYIRDESIGLLLDRCPMIERLSVRNCRKLTDASLKYMARKGSNIMVLDVGGCFNLTPGGMDLLISTHSNVTRFTELDVSGLRMGVSNLEFICKRCTNLETLRMGFMELGETILRQMLPPLLPKLQSLHVHWNSAMTDSSLAWLCKSAPRLKDLNLCGCSGISLEGVSDVLFERQDAVEADRKNRWSRIEKINVRYTPLNKQDVEALQGTFQDVTVGS